VLTHTNSDADRAKGDPVDFFDAAPFGFAPSLWLPRPFCAIAAEEVEKRHSKQMLKRADGQRMFSAVMAFVNGVMSLRAFGASKKLCGFHPAVPGDDLVIVATRRV
jgi:hypothetical protein